MGFAVIGERQLQDVFEIACQHRKAAAHLTCRYSYKKQPECREALARHLEALDPRYFTTYYAIDALNFAPADLSSALDPTFSEQKKILKRCYGLFYRCAGGVEARRFNRLLIEAGLIKGL
jgi:hypothetical protein